MSIPASNFRIHVRYFKLHPTAFLCRIFDGFDLIWRGYILYYWKIMSVLHFHHPCPSLKGSSSFPSVSAYRLMDTDFWTRTSVTYPMQINGLLPLTCMDTNMCSLAFSQYCVDHVMCFCTSRVPQASHHLCILTTDHSGPHLPHIWVFLLYILIPKLVSHWILYWTFSNCWMDQNFLHAF